MIPVLKLKYPNIKWVISVGGWLGSGTFSGIASNSSLSRTFAQNLMGFLNAAEFDGVNIDWEYPGGGGLSSNPTLPNDASNFLNMLKIIRETIGQEKLLTISLSSDPTQYSVSGVNYARQYADYVNFIQIMAYDYYGSWSPYSDFNAPLNAPGATDPVQPAANIAGRSIANTVITWLGMGLNPKSLVVGLPFYGRSWSVSSSNNNGIYQKCVVIGGQSSSINSYTPCPAIAGDFEDKAPYTGTWSWYSMRGGAGNRQVQAPLIAGTTTASGGWSRNYSAYAASASLFTSMYNEQPNVVIAYDDTNSMLAKSSWLRNTGLGGIMAWELTLDYKGELANAVVVGWNA
jgi:chitinase